MKRWLALVAAALLLVEPLAASPARKRAAPPPQASVTAAGVRYQTMRGAEFAGQIAAINAATGQTLWQLAVYPVRTDPDLEADKQDILITRLGLADRRRALIATDERGGRYRIDIAARAVTVQRPRRTAASGDRR